MLKQTISGVLGFCGRENHLMPDDLLQRECAMILGRRIGDNEFEQAVAEMKDAGQIEASLDPITSEPRYSLAATATA